MICTIPSRFVKVIAKAIHCLAKIGDELYVEALPTGLSLRTVNSARSAYACFLFLPAFFHIYDLDAESGSSSQDNQQKCKIAMKGLKTGLITGLILQSCMAVFRSPQMLDKSIDTCQIRLNMKESRLDFILNCRFGMVKTYNLHFQESEALQAVFSKDMCPNTLVASSKLLLDTVSNFRQQQEEVTLISDPEVLKMKNFVDDDEESNRVLLTELTVDPEEFDSYNVGVNSEITFCLKELRAILTFAEAVSQPVSLHFETAGKPIVFGLSCENAFEADFVLATLVEDITPAQSQKQSQAVPSTQTNPHKPHTSTPASHIRRVPAPPNDSEAVFSDVLSGRQIVSQDISAIKPATQTCTEVEPMKVENGQSQETQSCKNSSVDVVGPSTEVRLKERRDVVQPLSPGSEDDSDNDYDFDFIPKTPPKKFKSAFFGLGGAGAGVKRLRVQDQAEVLASDTDDEN